MCLEIDNKARRTKAVEDITVYKILKINDRGCYETPYRSFRVEILSTYESTLRKNIHDRDEVDYGLHSYGNYDDARTEVDEHRFWYGNSVIVRCTIPKNSFFYKGLFDKVTSYASTRLRYDEILKTY